jgi:hypothetical protein
MEALLGAADFDADEAERYGWINRALPDAELDDFVTGLASRIASFPVEALRATKQVLNELTLPAADAVQADAKRFQHFVAEDAFPPEIASHTSVQEFYFGDDYLLRRHDYRVEVAGGFPAVQYMYGLVEAEGIKLPSKRRAYRADAQGNAIRDQLMVSIDLSDICFG